MFLFSIYSLLSFILVSISVFSYFLFLLLSFLLIFLIQIYIFTPLLSSSFFCNVSIILFNFPFLFLLILQPPLWYFTIYVLRRNLNYILQFAIYMWLICVSFSILSLLFLSLIIVSISISIFCFFFRLFSYFCFSFSFLNFLIHIDAFMLTNFLFCNLSLISLFPPPYLHKPFL